MLLLNPDTEVCAGTLDTALHRPWSEKRIGMVGVKLLTDTGELDYAYKHSFPTPLAALAHFAGIGKPHNASRAVARAPHHGEDEPGEPSTSRPASRFTPRAVQAAAAAPFAKKSPSTPEWRASTRRLDGPERSPLANLAVYVGIGAKLVASVAITTLSKVRGT